MRTELMLSGPDPDVVEELKWHQENPEESKKKIYGKKKLERGELTVQVKYCMIDNPEWRKSNRNKLGLWLYLCSYIVRGTSSTDKYDIYHRYYCNNKLACTTSLRTIATAFGYKKDSLAQIGRWIEELFEEGAFIRDEIDVGKPKPQIVYVLGELKTTFNAKENKNETVEILYYNDQYK